MTSDPDWLWLANGAIEEFKGWRIKNGASPESASSYTSGARVFVAYCRSENVHPAIADADEVMDYAARTRGVSAAAQRDYRSHARAFQRFLDERGDPSPQRRESQPAPNGEPGEDDGDLVEASWSPSIDFTVLVPLFETWARAQAELYRHLGTANLADAWTELLVASALGGRLMPRSTKGHDMVLADGRRVEVKSRIWRGAVGDHQFGALTRDRDVEVWPFDAAALVQLDAATMRPRIAFWLDALYMPPPQLNGKGPRAVWGTVLFANRAYPGAVDLLPHLRALPW